MTIEVYPYALTYDLLLTTTTAVSHHDPAVQDDSNRQLFNRQKVMLPIGEAAPVAPELVERVAAAHPVPVDIADICRDLSFAEFVGVVIAREFMDRYNSANGVGLFEGMERYGRLETRLRLAAIVAPSLRALWDRLCATMQAPIHGGEHDLRLLDLLTTPMSVQQATLRAIAQQYRSIVSIARLWHSTAKLESEAYAEKAGMMAMVQPKQTMEFTTIEPDPARYLAAEMPVVSANSLRHQVVRAPALTHLFGALGLAEAIPGAGPLPASVEALFVNGGNIAAGAKQPSNANALANRARAAYPVLDLLGGVTDAFDIGASRLRVSGWLICRENALALAQSSAADLPMATVSAFDMLDDVTMTRQASPQGLGQMIASFETLAAGAQILCRLVLEPWTRLETRGALLAAIETFHINRGVVGGQSARGYGNVVGGLLEELGEADILARESYEEYLRDHRDELREGLVGGTLGTGVAVLS